MKKLFFSLCCLFLGFQTHLGATVCYSISNSGNVLTISVSPSSDYNTAPYNRWVTGNVTLSWDMSLGASVVDSYNGLNGFSFAPDGPARLDGSSYFQKFGFTFEDPLVYDLVNGTLVDVLEITVTHATQSTGDFSIAETTPSAVNNGGASFSNVFSDLFASGGCNLTVLDVPFDACADLQVPTGAYGFAYKTDEALLLWDYRPNVDRYRIQYRVQGTTSWTTFCASGSPRNQWLLRNLTPNTTYEWRMYESCSSGPRSDATPIMTFTLDDNNSCSEPEEIGYAYFANGNPTKVYLYCNYEPNLDLLFRLQWRELGTSTWSSQGLRNNRYTVQNLSPSTTYEYRWRARCSGIWTSYTAPDTFTTLPAPPPIAPRNESDFEEMESTKTGSFTLFPNPTNEAFNMEFGTETLPSIVRVFDVQGKMVLEHTPTDFVERIDAARLPSGTYSVQAVWDNEDVLVQRLVKL